MPRLRPALQGLTQGLTRRGRRFGAGAVCGVLVALSIPPFGWWPLAWVGLAGLVLAIAGEGWRARLAVGTGFGLANYFIGLLWVQEFSVYGYVGVVLISTVYAALAVVAVPTGRWRWMAIGAPAAFVLSDWARDRFPVGGLPLAGVALGQASGPFAPVARLGGSLAVTGETVLAGVALAAAVHTGMQWYGRKEPRSRLALPPAVGVVAAAAAVVALPVAGLLSPAGAGGHLAPLRIGLVQGGGPRGTRAIYTDPQVVFDRHLQASADLSGPLDLIVWPEGILQSHFNYAQSEDAAELSELAQSHDATLVAGVEQDVNATQYLNEVVAWSPSGAIVGTYVKNHLVPFGEYVPYRAFFQKFFNLADVPYDGIPGHGPGFLRTPAAPLAVMISFEVFFDERARGGVRAGGQVLVVPTNTASYRSTQVPTQEVAADKLRTWETGRWLAQVTPTGYSTVVSPTGKVERKSHLDAQQVIEYAVPRETGLTVYDHIGDATVAAVVLAGLATMWSMAAWDRRRRRTAG